MLNLHVNNLSPECQFEGMFPKITSGTGYCIFQDFSLKQHILRSKFKKKKFNEKTIPRGVSRVKGNNK